MKTEVRMIRSMTAFAREQQRGELGELVWELRSVNQRFLDINVRLPEELRVLETVLRERLGKRLGRGKVDATLRYRPGDAAAASVRVNERLVGQLLGAAEHMSGRLPESPGPSVMDVLRWPGVIETEEQDLDRVQAAAVALLEHAIDSLVATREREGARLHDMLEQRCQALREQVVRARERMPVVVAGLRDRLRARLAELSEELDEGRVEQEMVLLTHKLDVDEEMDRLGTHLDEVRRVLKKGGAVGRRLDFLMQELNREANTLGSKSADSQTTAISVEMKVLIEQMREQVQNIE
jgi:uncharacterized protein (TIGR00255 family)